MSQVEIAAFNEHPLCEMEPFLCNIEFLLQGLGSKLARTHHPLCLFDRNWVELVWSVEYEKKWKTPSLSSGTT